MTLFTSRSALPSYNVVKLEHRILLNKNLKMSEEICINFFFKAGMDRCCCDVVIHTETRPECKARNYKKLDKLIKSFQSKNLFQNRYQTYSIFCNQQKIFFGHSKIFSPWHNINNIIYYSILTSFRLSRDMISVSQSTNMCFVLWQ